MLGKFIADVRSARLTTGKSLPACCLFIEGALMTTSLLHAFRVGAEEKCVTVGHLYAAERVILPWEDREEWIEKLAVAGLWFNDNRGGEWGKADTRAAATSCRAPTDAPTAAGCAAHARLHSGATPSFPDAAFS